MAGVPLLLSILQVGCKQAKKGTVPAPDYASTVQKEPMCIQWRKQIVEWVADCVGEFRLGEDTLALAVNFFDRLLSAVVVPAAQLQTASLACLFLASKLLERRPLSMKQIGKYFAEIASCDEVRMAELNILFYLKWNTNAFTALDFIRTALQLVPDQELKSEIQKRAEAVHRTAMLDYGSVRFLPCALGFGCIDIACGARGFDVTPLREGLAQSGIQVNDDPSVLPWLRALVSSTATAGATAATATAATLATPPAAAPGYPHQPNPFQQQQQQHQQHSQYATATSSSYAATNGSCLSPAPNAGGRGLKGGDSDSHNSSGGNGGHRAPFFSPPHGHGSSTSSSAGPSGGDAYPSSGGSRGTIRVSASSSAVSSDTVSFAGSASSSSSSASASADVSAIVGSTSGADISIYLSAPLAAPESSVRRPGATKYRRPEEEDQDAELLLVDEMQPHQQYQQEGRTTRVSPPQPPSSSSSASSSHPVEGRGDGVYARRGATGGSGGGVSAFSSTLIGRGTSMAVDHNRPTAIYSLPAVREHDTSASGGSGGETRTHRDGYHNIVNDDDDDDDGDNDNSMGRRRGGNGYECEMGGKEPDSLISQFAEAGSACYQQELSHYSVPHQQQQDRYDDDSDEARRAAAASVCMGELIPAADDIDSWEAMASPRNNNNNNAANKGRKSRDGRVSVDMISRSGSAVPGSGYQLPPPKLFGCGLSLGKETADLLFSSGAGAAAHPVPESAALAAAAFALPPR